MEQNSYFSVGAQKFEVTPNFWQISVHLVWHCIKGSGGAAALFRLFTSQHGISSHDTRISIHARTHRPTACRWRSVTSYMLMQLFRNYVLGYKRPPARNKSKIYSKLVTGSMCGRGHACVSAWVRNDTGHYVTYEHNTPLARGHQIPLTPDQWMWR